MKLPVASLLAVGGLFGAGCGSVPVPAERFYRLAAPEPRPPAADRAGILRVQDLQLGTALDSDRLMRQVGPRLEPHPLSRWTAPLDRLVTDAMILGLSRARVCELVKGSADPGPETWTLHGRIVDFVEAAGPEGPSARVGLELWLEDGSGLLLHDEFTAVEPMSGGGADGAAEALSRALAAVVLDLVVRMRGLELFAAARKRTAAEVLAAPLR